MPAQAESPFLVPYHAAEKPIIDAQGRKSIIIDFVDDAHEKFPKDPPPGWDSKASFHRPQVVNLVNAHAKTHGYEPQGMTTWVGSSTTAYLNEAQIKRMREDKSLKLLTENQRITSSSAPPWGNTAVGGETWSWGRNALSGKSKMLGSERVVYIVDGGVASHSDLGSVVDRVNVGCGSGGGCSSYDYPVVGCWAHATHVAGIIGATDNNGQGVAGVYAGVKMVSVAVHKATYWPGGNMDTRGVCGRESDGSDTGTNSIGYALDYLFWRVFTSGTQTVPIVNLSLNPAQMGFDQYGNAQTNRYKVSRLVTPAYYTYQYYPTYGQYPGVFFVQSAGNYNMHSCNTPSPAYRDNPSAAGVSATDGIMVVGAIHHTGEPVSASSPFSGSYPSGLSTPSPSNYGSCIDVWAPGNLIVSTWGEQTPAPAPINPGQPSDAVVYSKVGTTYSGSPVTGSSGWLFLSGTSMAAPHISGAAAYVADAYGLTTPSAIEQKLRQFYVWDGWYDSAGNLVYRVQLP